MALRELVMESLKNEKEEIEIFGREPSRVALLEAFYESLVILVTGDLVGFQNILRVIIERTYCMGYQRGKSEIPDSKKLEDLLGDIDLSSLEK